MKSYYQSKLYGHTCVICIEPVSGGVPEGTFQILSGKGKLDGFVSPEGEEVGSHAFGNVTFKVCQETQAHQETLRKYVRERPTIETRKAKIDR